MLSKIGTTELLLVLAVALVFLGPTRLPALGKMVGKAIGSARKYMNGVMEEIDDLEKDIKAPIPSEKAAEIAAAQPEAPAVETVTTQIQEVQENAV